MKAKLLLIFIAAVLSTACTRKIYLPTETRIETHAFNADTTQTERISKLIDQLQKSVKTQEKVVVRDSVVYVVNEQGSVVSKETFRDRDRDYSESVAVTRVTQIYDSLFQRQAQCVDSIISTFRQTPVVVEKEPGFWSCAKYGFYGAAAAAILAAIFLLLRKIKSKYFH